METKRINKIDGRFLWNRFPGQMLRSTGNVEFAEPSFCNLQFVSWTSTARLKLYLALVNELVAAETVDWFPAIQKSTLFSAFLVTTLFIILLYVLQEWSLTSAIPSSRLSWIKMCPSTLVLCCKLFRALFLSPTFWKTYWFVNLSL